MTSEPPSPPVPLNADLTNFPFTPIYRARLFGSAFHARVSDSEWRAGVTLWLKSQDQRPAGSLPDDDVELCRLAELGRDMKTWKRVRTGALHGWYRCNDGRLYHNTVAETVMSQWGGKTEQRQRTLKGRIAALEKRLSLATTDQAKTDIGAQIQKLRQELSPQTTEPVTGSVTASVTESPTEAKGEGEGEGEGEGDRKGDREGESISTADADFPGWYEVYPRKEARDAALRAYRKARKQPGVTAEILIAGAERVRRDLATGAISEKRFVKQPATWLNGGCWADEDSAAQAPPGPSAGGWVERDGEQFWKPRFPGDLPPG